MADIYVNANLFMLAGTETSATVLSGCLYHLCVNPDLLVRLQREIDGTFRSNEEINMARCQPLRYLNACLMETLRIYPAVPVGMAHKTPPGGAIILDQLVPGNVSPHGDIKILVDKTSPLKTPLQVQVWVHQYATFHSAENFASPESFIPDRWLDDNHNFNSDDKDALQPFSIGPQNCIGQK